MTSGLLDRGSMEIIEQHRLAAEVEGLSTDEVILNMGPQHPSTHGVLRLVLTLRGETVVKCLPVVGYLHRGIEKILESRPYLSGIRYIDQFDYLCQTIQEHAYVGAIERLMKVEVPRRAQYMRVILDELHRLASHIAWVGFFVNDLGGFTPIVYCFRDREVILDFFEAFGGSRFNVNVHRVGGLVQDAPQGWLQQVESFMHEFLRNLDEYDNLVTGNEIFLARTRNVGVITQEAALAYGICGPCLRATGIPYDVRSAFPYEVYPELNFVPQTDLGGDIFARHRVRMAELRESVRMIQLAIANLPNGPIRARVPHLMRPPKGEVYFATETSKGEWGTYLVSDGSQYPYRAKIRRPSFVNLQILPELLEGQRIGDVIAILGSIDIVLGEVDA